MVDAIVVVPYSEGLYRRHIVQKLSETRLYHVVSWSTSKQSSPEVHSADDVSLLMKSSVLNVFSERRVIMTCTGNGGVTLIVHDTSIWSDRPTSLTSVHGWRVDWHHDDVENAAALIGERGDKLMKSERRVYLFHLARVHIC